MTLADLAAALGCPFEGDGSLNLMRVATIEQAGSGDLTFLANRKYARALAATGIAVLAHNHGSDACRTFLAQCLGRQYTPDARGWIRDVITPVSSRLRNSAKIPVSVLTSEWRDSLKAPAAPATLSP